MSLYNEKKQTSGIVEVWVKDDVDLAFNHKAYEIDEANMLVRYFPSPKDRGLAIQKIDFVEFKKLPHLLHENGYIRTYGLSYANDKKLQEKNVQELTVLFVNLEPAIQELDNGLAMTLPYSELELLAERFKAIQAEAKLERSQSSSNLFSSLFPDFLRRKRYLKVFASKGSWKIWIRR